MHPKFFFKTFLLKWVQFRVGAIPRIPKIMVMIMKIKHNDNNNKNNNNDDDICLVPSEQHLSVLSPIDDVRGSGEYRIDVVAEQCRRAVKKAALT